MPKQLPPIRPIPKDNRHGVSTAKQTSMPTVDVESFIMRFLLPSSLSMRFILCFGTTESGIFSPNSVNDSCWPFSKDWVTIIREYRRLACRLGHCFLSKSCKVEISRMMLLSSWFLAKFIKSNSTMRVYIIVSVHNYEGIR